MAKIIFVILVIFSLQQLVKSSCAKKGQCEEDYASHFCPDDMQGHTIPCDNCCPRPCKCENSKCIPIEKHVCPIPPVPPPESFLDKCQVDSDCLTNQACCYNGSYKECTPDCGGASCCCVTEPCPIGKK